MKILYCDYRISPSAGVFVSNLQRYFPECEVECWQYTDDNALLEKLKGTQGLLTANLKVNGRVMEQTSDLKVISVDATGCGNIDVNTAKKQGILVCSMGAYCTDEVADHTIMLVLMLEKRVKAHLKNIEHKRVFDYKLCQPPHRIRGKNLVIFGYGRIGKAVARRAIPFGYQVYAVPHDTSKIGIQEGAISFIAPEKAFEIADVIVNNMSENTETFEFFRKETFIQCKKEPIFINVGRGSAVNETDLLEALNTGTLSGAGLDVMKEVYPDLTNSPFIGMDQVIITPHMAFHSIEAVEAIRSLPVKNLVNGLLGKLDEISNIAN